MAKTILVMGATGKLGEPVARHLQEDSFQVRIMTRDKDKARRLFDESFDIVAEDSMDTKTLEKALDGCVGVHITISSLAIEPLIAQ